MLPSKVRFRPALRWLVLAGAAALFVAVLSAADVHRVGELVASVGVAGIVVVLLPQAAAILAESYGWKRAIRVIGREVGLGTLARVRVATEALSQTLPAGIVFGESAKPLLLQRHSGLALGEGVGALVARKYLLVLSQAAFVSVVAILGFRALERASLALIGFPGLPWLAVGVGCVLSAIAAGSAAWLRRSSVACRLFAALRAIPFAPLARFLSRSERRFSEADLTVAAFFRAGLGRHVVPAAWFVLAWALEAVETYVILRVLGADVAFIEIASVEVLLTFLRHVVFVVPAGLGVQDLGYVAAFSALGIRDAPSLGAAFVLVKRAKELAWIALGYALLAAEAKPSETPRAAVGASRA